MKITADTNVLVRAAVPANDPASPDAAQAVQAQAALREAKTIVVTLPTLCEFVWVLRGLYRFDRDDIAAAIRRLISASTVVCDRPAIEAGLRVLGAGGDFADGVIASAGAMMGGDTFVSFDRKAVRLIVQSGQAARLLGEGAA